MAAVELGILSPLVVAILLGILEVGRLIEIDHILQNAVREGGRQAATGQLDNGQVQQVVLNYLQNDGIPTTHATVTVNDLTAPGTDAAAASQMDQLQVTVSVPFQDVRWITLRLVTTASTQLSASATWVSLKDQSYPSSVTAPAGF
jgi:Flp pilus assembly protein TadG